MKTIMVNEFIASAFSQEKAIIIRGKIEEGLKNEDKIVLDFSGITKFTTLFFNFSTGYYISLLGPEVYNERITLTNLSDLGKSTYNSSYENAVGKYIPKKEIQNKILDIISNIEN